LFSSMRRSAEVRKALGVLAVALLGFIVTLLGVVVAGAALLPGKHDVLYAFALVVTACLASLTGLRMTRSDSEHVHNTRVRNAFIWFLLVVVTLIAGAELVTSG
jgi:zinc transporter ZupT